MKPLPTLDFRTVTYCADARCTALGACWRAANERYGDAPGENYGPRCSPVPSPDDRYAAMKRAFNAADTLCVEIGYALEGKDVPRGKDELLDRVLDLCAARRLDNEDLARSFDMGWDAATAAAVAWLRKRANAPHPIERGVPSLSPAGRGLLLLHADSIERGEHRREEDK